MDEQLSIKKKDEQLM